MHIPGLQVVKVGVVGGELPALLQSKLELRPVHL